MQPSEPLFDQTAVRVVRLCAFGSGALAALTLTGWGVVGWERLTLGGRVVPMAPSTAVLMLLLAGALAGRSQRPYRPGWNRLILVAGGLCLIVGCFTLTRMVLGFELDWEGWFGKSPGTLHGLPLERLSPSSSAMLLVLGTAALLQARPFTRWGEVHHLSATVAATVALVSLTTLVGYCYGTPFVRGAAPVVLSPVTATVFLMLGAGWVLAAGPETWLLRALAEPTWRGQLLRWAIPAVGLITLAQTIWSVVVAPGLTGSRPYLAAIIVMASVGAWSAAAWWAADELAQRCMPSAPPKAQSQQAWCPHHRGQTILNRVVRQVLRARSQEELLQETCRAVVEQGGFQVACVGRRDDPTGLLRLVFFQGEAGGFLRELETHVIRDQGEANLLEAVLRQGRARVCNELDGTTPKAAWQDIAVRHGFRAAGAWPLRVGEQPWGVLAVFDRRRAAFQAEDDELFQDVALCVASVLEKWELARSRQRAEELWRQTERRLTELEKRGAGIIYQFRVGKDGAPRQTYISPRVALYGLSTDPAHEDWKLGAHIHPDDRERFFHSVALSIMHRTDWTFEGRALTPNGEVRWFRASSSLQEVEGELVYDGVLFDLTDIKQLEARLRACEEQRRQLEERVSALEPPLSGQATNKT